MNIISKKWIQEAVKSGLIKDGNAFKVFCVKNKLTFDKAQMYVRSRRGVLELMYVDDENIFICSSCDSAADKEYADTCNGCNELRCSHCEGGGTGCACNRQNEQDDEEEEEEEEEDEEC